MAANQGSRAGLITTVVILSIVSVTAIIFAFWYGAEKRKVDLDLDDLKKQYAEILPVNQLSSDSVQGLKALRTAPDGGFDPKAKLFDMVGKQRDDLIKVITGKDAAPDNTQASALKLVAAKLLTASDQVKKANTQMPTDNLVGAIDVLADKVRVQAQALADRDTKLADAEKRTISAVRQKEADLASRDQQVADLSGKIDAEIKNLGDARTSLQAKVAEIEKARDEERRTSQEALTKKDIESTSKDAELKKLKERLAVTQARFDRIRVGVSNVTLRNSAGQISTISDSNIVFINIGQGRGLLPGLTFEVYDHNKGIPKITDPLAEEMPQGKASIEVLHILESTSECRIIRKTPGQQVAVGDPIVNVIYDPNIKYNFAVFGKFDLDRNGVATAQDADVVKRLITQWGGNVASNINVETDFLVIGQEPVIPTFAQEEMADPLNVKKRADAAKDLEDWQNVIAQAKELHIPILNQNRFLAFTGQSGVITR